MAPLFSSLLEEEVQQSDVALEPLHQPTENPAPNL
jgi:hypothetical protein